MTTNKQLIKFIKSRLTSFLNCNGIKGEAGIKKALKDNQEKWIKEFIILTN